MSKMIKKAETHLDFGYPDLADDIDRRPIAGSKNENESISFVVKKGAGSVSVDCVAEYDGEGKEYDPDYFVKLFKDVTAGLADKFGDVYFSEIRFTCTDRSTFTYKAE